MSARGAPDAADLERAASRALIRTWSWLCAAALVSAVLVVAIDLGLRWGVVGAPTVVARLLAALATALLGATVVWAAIDRHGRELARRRPALVLMAVGGAILYGGQAVGYLVTAQDSGLFRGWIEAVPLLACGVPLGIAAVMLSWPPGMTRRDLLSVVRDAAMAAFALAILWVAFLVPAQEASHGSPHLWIEEFDPWLQYAGFMVIVVIAATSRRSGSLPIGQLMLLQGSMLVYLVSDILGHVVSWADRESLVTYSIVGYVAAAYLLISFAIRPALEIDPPRGAQMRDIWSRVVPYLPVPIAIAAVVQQIITGQMSPTEVLLTLAMVGMATLIMLGERIALAGDARQMRDRQLTTRLESGNSGAWFDALIGDTQDLVTVVDRDGRIVYQTPSALPMLGYHPQDNAGRFFSEIAEGNRRRDVAALLLRSSHNAMDRGPYEINLVTRQGGRCPTETWVKPLRTADGADGFVLTSRDVTDRRRLRAELADSTVRDSLTSLFNREGFLANLRREVPGAVPETLAVALFDLDSFRDLNDASGHEAGDQVLRAVAEVLDRLPATVRSVARTGPDEFGLIVVADPVEFTLGEIEREISDGLDGILLSNGETVTVGLSFGYTVMGPGCPTTSELMEEADLAVAAARTQRTKRMMRFDPAMRATLVNRLRAEADLREALDGGQLVVHYQPVVDMADGSMRSVEALARLRAPDGSLIPPNEFIPLAEQLGLIKQIGEIVLIRALADAALISAAVGRDISVAVNVSADQLDDSLLVVVQDALHKSLTPARQLVLELTETALASSQTSAAHLLSRLQALGCAIALDDFGTGYSSMAYLADLPVDRLKIDRSFVGSMGSSPKSMILVRTLLQLAHSLGMTAIAEGVETMEQADLLRGMECDRAQGYLFARPMAVADLLLMIQVTGGLLPLAAD